MRILCVGGGPAGLYFALLMKKLDPGHEVVVYERNRPDDTFGWGVVLSDSTLDSLKAADRESYDAIQRNFYHWDDIEVHFKGRVIRSGGHGFAGIARKRLLLILQERARELGVHLAFQYEVEDVVTLAEEWNADLVVAADGVNSRIRSQYAHAFQPEIEWGKCRYVWLGTHKPFKAFTFAFEQTQWGWFTAHAYPFDHQTSTFIVETPEEVWKAAGMDRMEKEESIAFCERLFARHLDGHALMSNAAHLRGSAQWLRFPWLHCKSWVHRLDVKGRPVPLVLMGDAAHTVHFSVGSGTKLAMEDAIGLVKAFAKYGDQDERAVVAALKAYEADRKVELLRLRNAARNSADWFENVKRYAYLEPEQFAYTLLTRSQRLFHEELRQRDSNYIKRFEIWFARQCGLGDQPVPPMFTPFQLRSIRLKNRVVVSPMAMYSAIDGTPNDFHLVHLGARALGGAALVFTEMTAVSREGRISPGCAGMYKRDHVDAWKRIVEFVHQHTDAKIALQLGHSGPKGSTRVGWEGYHKPLPDGNWPVIAPSPIPWSPENQVPRAMTREDMDRVKADFVRATQWAIECGFDWLELHCGHGYLLSAFISPLTNRRTDEYGGSLENRMRFPLEVFRAMREVWPAHLPMSVRISAHDWAPGGITPDDAVEIARLFKEAGADLIDVSSGQTTLMARPVYGRLYQTPFADRIRHEVGIATMAVGSIYEADHVNSIIASGRADLCAIARPHLANPHWTLLEAAKLGYTKVGWPKQYLDGKEQLERLMARAQAAQEGERAIIEELERIMARAAQDRAEVEASS
ncbi:bifunctional salicylyl-CoA 5-hydroxylase/oxidoreductase [Thermaerobacter sp. FW80]|uniref:bifunctional salicylyl-CoA 5-hydroxylase/oxidoreductase n=1 Tax=Thermaerobacter sp. FW80 TaxID=2546351 RepID=UPI001074CA93|nr:bifunctional salicylyl-CoA 5-hydroxylase/oxidoreductase [Thermaerobacter sp. FW80]QBS36635.1 bifunctional salicylyl-CoA 5-hydroxylase/oxidoreductase [Thermaerobacter sp. FW80]